MAGACQLAAGYRDFGVGPRFCVDWTPARSPSRGALLLLPAFGEEMNKCRRTLALAARRLAESGFQVRSVDAFGTGDSPGEFGEARWATWVDDYRAAAADLARTSGQPVGFWAVRSGSLLATELTDDGSRVLLWQPVVSGDQFLTQILRVKVAADTFGGKGATTTTKELRKRLEAGERLEVAGYDLDPELVLPMAQRTLGEWRRWPAHIDWLETGGEPSLEPPPGSARAIAALRSHGVAIDYGHGVGEPFWMTLEIAENSTLADFSIDRLGATTA